MKLKLHEQGVTHGAHARWGTPSLLVNNVFAVNDEHPIAHPAGVSRVRTIAMDQAATQDHVASIRIRHAFWAWETKHNRHQRLAT